MSKKRGLSLEEKKTADKIGISNFFWSFPSEAAVKLRSDQERLQTQLAEAKRRSAELSTKLEQERKGKEDTAVRSEKLAALQALEAKLKSAQAEIALYADSDPKKMEAMREATGIAKASANRWLDNVWALQSWCKKRFEGNESSLDAFFKENGLSEDMDYIA
ncbi:hypothetical protein WJX81_002821 [Elliptochloris bilobata]|uniref:Leucine zipper with capping helix domain-containing protein n=1 Tax=Elliptochloris bilobata TaxID=381761 RepID=A0AAW1QZ22_9CHLO